MTSFFLALAAAAAAGGAPDSLYYEWRPGALARGDDLGERVVSLNLFV